MFSFYFEKGKNLNSNIWHVYEFTLTTVPRLSNSLQIVTSLTFIFIWKKALWPLWLTVLLNIVVFLFEILIQRQFKARDVAEFNN